jgi:hypothetical protein
MDQLSANVPRLEPNGANWAIFSMCFREAMQATRRWGYDFNGNKTRLVPKDKEKPTDDGKLAMETWDYENELACFFLSEIFNFSALRGLTGLTVSTVARCFSPVMDVSW